MNFLNLKNCPHCGHNEFWVRAQYIGTSIFIYNSDTREMDDFDDYADYASIPAFCRKCGKYVGDYAERRDGEPWKALAEKAEILQQELVQQELDRAQSGQNRHIRERECK